MSQLAARPQQLNVGNTARALASPLTGRSQNSAPLPAAKRARTPLALVTSAPKRSRSQLVVILFLVGMVAMSVVLIMSISVSKGQYELVGLKSEQSDLLKSNQALQQEIAAKQAPQKLVVSAAALGMVPAGTTGQIDIRTQTVSGSPQPAPADAKGLVVIPPALVEKPKAVAIAPEPVVPLSPAAKEAALGAAAEAKAKTVPPVIEPEAELHGGSIPAPAQKDG